MIRVTVELFPHGDKDRRKTLATMDLWNTGTGDHDTGNYNFVMWDKARRAFRRGALRGFRRRDFSVWWLISAALSLALPNVARTFDGNKIDGEVVHEPFKVEEHLPK